MSAKEEKLDDIELDNQNETEEPVEEDVNQEQSEEEAGVNKLEDDFLKLKDDYVRLYAEMENMKKRTQQETEKTIKFAISSFAKELLGVADNLERAIAAMSDKDEACADLLKGVELTQSELTKVFEKFGVKRFNHVGEIFNPNFERVVQEVENPDVEAGTILSELQAGYTIHDRILREAMVIVAK